MPEPPSPASIPTVSVASRHRPAGIGSSSQSRFSDRQRHRIGRGSLGGVSVAVQRLGPDLARHAASGSAFAPQGLNRGVPGLVDGCVRCGLNRGQRGRRHPAAAPLVSLSPTGPRRLQAERRWRPLSVAALPRPVVKAARGRWEPPTGGSPSLRALASRRARPSTSYAPTPCSPPRSTPEELATPDARVDMLKVAQSS